VQNLGKAGAHTRPLSGREYHGDQSPVPGRLPRVRLGGHGSWRCAEVWVAPGRD
jgi:hypothetical protein